MSDFSKLKKNGYVFLAFQSMQYFQSHNYKKNICEVFCRKCIFSKHIGLFFQKFFVLTNFQENYKNVW